MVEVAEEECYILVIVGKAYFHSLEEIVVDLQCNPGVGIDYEPGYFVSPKMKIKCL